MEDQETQLRLMQQDATLVISASVWRELIDVAQQKGWRSEHAPACYWGDIGLDVTASDARRLSRTFEAMGDYLVHGEIQNTAEHTKLVEDLGELVIFCRAGGFRVC